VVVCGVDWAAATRLEIAANNSEANIFFIGSPLMPKCADKL
jgi:hypothetical protein